MKTKLHHPIFALSILGIIYLVSLALMILAGPGSNAAMVSVGLQVCIPYLVPFALIGGVEAIEKYFDPIWIKVSLLLVTAIYAVLSASWASSVLNSAFSVPASNFPIAHALIALAYLPGELLAPLVSVVISLLVASATIVLLLALFASSDWKQAIKRISLLVAVTFYLGFVLGSTMFLQRNKVFLAQMIAVSTDFDTAHRCKNLASLPGAKVAHVGQGNVLVFKGRTTAELNMEKDFELRKCQTSAEI